MAGEAMIDTDATTTAPRNPIGVVIVAVATGLRAIFILASLLADLGVIRGGWLASMSPIPVLPGMTSVALISRGILVAMLVISLLCVWGLLRRHEWGWTLSIITTGVILAFGIGWWAAGEAHYFSMLLNSIAVFYLNQRDVRAAFHVGRP
jgi:hypothetical protein